MGGWPMVKILLAMATTASKVEPGGLVVVVVVVVVEVVEVVITGPYPQLTLLYSDSKSKVPPLPLW